MHEIRYIEFDNNKTQRQMFKCCDEIARRNDEYGNGLASPLQFFDKSDCLKGYDNAVDYLVSKAEGRFYPQLAVRYKDGRRKKWLARIEYHV